MAETWAPAASSNTEQYFVDVDGLSRTGAVVHSWTKEVFLRPSRDARTGKLKALSLMERFDDCDGGRYSFGDYVDQAKDGSSLGSGNAAQGWQKLFPGTVGAGIQKMVCTLTKPPEEEAFLENILSGKWESLGRSSDDKYEFFQDFGNIYKLDDSHIVTFGRSHYDDYQIIGGVPVKYVLSMNLMDCENRTSGSAGADFYTTPKLRGLAVRIKSEDVKLEPLAPGSFGFRNLARLCAEAVPVSDDAGDGEEDGGEAAKPGSMSVGTGWFTAKGYMITAAHVVAGGRKIEIYAEREKVGEATALRVDKANDLAVLKITKWTAPRPVGLSLADKPGVLGKPVFTLGFPSPGVMGQSIKMTSGEVSALAGMQDDVRFLQVSAAVQPGNSGGPLLGWDGRVYGVIEARLESLGDSTEVKPQLVNYAIKASYVKPLTDDLDDLKTTAALPANLGSEAMIDTLSRSVFLVAVQH